MSGGHNHAERSPSDRVGLSLERSVIGTAVLTSRLGGYILEESDKRAAHSPSAS